MSKLKAKDRILARLVPAGNGCLEWSGYRQPNGYGQTSLDGRLMPAHRAMYQAHHGVNLSRDQDVCHACDNRACCNIDHLFVGSSTVNMRDARSKGRHVSITHPESFPRGERSYRAKITEAQAIEIKRLISIGLSCGEIAKRFPISRDGVSKIKHNKSWKHLCQN